MHPLLATYQAQFTSLNRFKGAMYKPLLLLSVIQLIADGTIRRNRIGLAEIPELEYAFRSNWLRLLDVPYQNKFVMPFYHMSGEPFWQIVPLPGREIGVTKSHSFRSFADLKRNLDHVRLDPELFELLSNPVLNRVLEETVMSAYFPGKATGEGLEGPAATEQLDWIFSDHELMPIRKMTRAEREQVIAVRNVAFRRGVRQVYGYRCAISGVSVQSDSGRNYLVEACHIKPFSDSLTESISNGIALTSTLHSAFDSGLISLDQNYKVMIASRFREAGSPYNLSQFAGKEILLPVHRRFYPSQESLEWHRDERFDRFG